MYVLWFLIRAWGRTLRKQFVSINPSVYLEGWTFYFKECVMLFNKNEDISYITVLQGNSQTQ